MRACSAVKPLVDGWPEARQAYELSKSGGIGSPAFQRAMTDLGETPPRHLLAAIFMLWDEQPSPTELARVRQHVETAVSMAPDDPYVRLYAGLTMLDLRDLRCALEHAKALRDHDMNAVFVTPQSEAAVAHLVGRLVAAGGRNDDLAAQLLEHAVELDPYPIEYGRALERHLSEHQQIVLDRERPPIELVIARLPLT